MSIQTEITQAVFVGTGGMARHHLRRILAHFPDTHVPVVCEPSAEQFELAAQVFEEQARPVPENEPRLESLLSKHADKLDAAFIITPHVFHFEQAKACLEAGLDVLLEKPMVMTAKEAEQLIEISERTGKLLVVSFNGSLSPNIRRAVEILRSEDLGEILSISATVWQNWDEPTVGTWRQVPKMAGGGFMFDTGAHMLNTVCDLAGEDFVEVAAWLDKRNRDVDLLGTVMGRLASGVMVTLHASGDTVKIGSDVRVFCKKGIIYTDVWGKWLELQCPEDDSFVKIETPESKSVWEQFLAVQQGEIENPSPARVGLRMARLWDAIKASADQGGAVVKLG